VRGARRRISALGNDEPPLRRVDRREELLEDIGADDEAYLDSKGARHRVDAECLVRMNPVLRQNSIGVVCLETSAETLPFSCPLEPTKAGKRRQRAAQGESPKSLDIPSEDASSGNAEQGSAKRG